MPFADSAAYCTCDSCEDRYELDLVRAVVGTPYREEKIGQGRPNVGEIISVSSAESDHGPTQVSF